MASQQVEQVSLASLQYLLAQNGERAFLPTVEIDHHTFDQPYRFICDVLDLTDSNGVSYIAYPFETEFPDDREDKIPTVNLKIGNVDERIIPALRGIVPPPPQVRMGLVMREDPDNPVVVPLAFEMTGIDYDAKTITGTLTYQFKVNAKFPKDTVNPATCPGVF